MLRSSRTNLSSEAWAKLVRGWFFSVEVGENIFFALRNFRPVVLAQLTAIEAAQFPVRTRECFWSRLNYLLTNIAFETTTFPTRPYLQQIYYHKDSKSKLETPSVPAAIGKRR